MTLQPLTILLALTATSYVSGEIDLLKIPFLNNINVDKHFDVENSFGIINGTKTDILHHPYQAGIWINTGSNKKQLFMSGTIVDKKWILTLGLLPAYAPELSVSVGKSKISEVTEFLELEKIELHPGSTGGTRYHASLMKLKKPLKFSKTVKPIAIASSSPKSGSKAVISGWGLKSFKKFEPSNDLLETQLSVITRSECKPKFIASYVSETVTCGYKKGVRPTILDGGSPFVQNKKMVGMFLADFTTPALCNTYPECPALFTDVTLLKSWVTDTIKKE